MDMRSPNLREVCNSDQTIDSCHGKMPILDKDSLFPVSLAAPGGHMWIAKHLKLSHAYSELETLTAERSAELQKLTQRSAESAG